MLSSTFTEYQRSTIFLEYGDVGVGKHTWVMCGDTPNFRERHGGQGDVEVLCMEIPSQNL